MKFTDRLTAAVMSSVIIVVQAPPANALEESAINKIAKQITVRIDGKIFHCNQFSKLKPSTLVKSLSLETTVKPLIIAVAAIKTSSV
jgi:hypothetical protein